MTQEPLYFKTHIFCCTNEREAGHARGCCKEKGGEAIRDYMKKRAKELKIDAIRVNASGCLDRCELGPTLVIYPEGIWYHCPTTQDAEEILQSHVLGGKPVERLKLGVKQKRL